jgi:hypothetical protein
LKQTAPILPVAFLAVIEAQIVCLSIITGSIRCLLLPKISVRGSIAISLVVRRIVIDGGVVGCDQTASEDRHIDQSKTS